ncbi:MAG: hypothetical protein DRI86_08620 [Bacteroidetes bacterium]|nr:MAG: hypothetical protein DRI86_08620 [Bacteroidota bacterium]
MIKTKKRITLSLITLILITLSSFSNNNDWKKYKEIDGVIIYSKITKCNTEYNTAINEYIVFKYVNTNSYNIRISWKLNLWHNDICRSCDLQSPNEYEISLDIKAGQTLEYICSDNNKAFKLFKSSKKGNMFPRVKYEFENLKVDKL